MKYLRPAVFLFILFSAGTGLVYPFLVTGVANLFFSHRAHGSLIMHDHRVVGSELIGQVFTGPRYFHGRPSANKYDGTNSGGTNYAPSNAGYLKDTAARVREVRSTENLPADATVPADLVLASASGLDPDISLQSALIQAPRVAAVRGLSQRRVTEIVRTTATRWYAGGPERVNVLTLNLAMDRLHGSIPGRK